MTHSPTCPARYRDIFAVAEFRVLFAAHLLSLIGDQLSKLAVSVVVFHHTGSALFAAVAFGISYLPWVLIGPALASLSDRFPRRTVMVTCDLTRAALVAVLLLPGLPVSAMVGVLFVSALFAPPAQAARSAILPEVLDGDAYVVAVSLNVLSFQAAQVVGFAGGGLLIAVLSARGALLADAITFVLSAALVGCCVAQRRAASGAEGKASVLRETVAGARLVLGTPTLRAFLLLAWIGVAFRAAPDGVMVAYAGHLGDRGMAPETTIGLLLSATPLGTVCGAVCYGRLTGPDRRWRLVPTMALLMCAGLVPMLLDPVFPVVLMLLFIAGYGAAYHGPLSARFIQEMPVAYRGRAAGLATAGMMAGTGLSTPVAGALADAWANPPMVIGLCGVAGVLCMLPVLLRWPATDRTRSRWALHRHLGGEGSMAGGRWESTSAANATRR